MKLFIDEAVFKGFADFFSFSFDFFLHDPDISVYFLTYSTKNQTKWLNTWVISVCSTSVTSYHTMLMGTMGLLFIDL